MKPRRPKSRFKVGQVVFFKKRGAKAFPWRDETMPGLVRSVRKHGIGYKYLVKNDVYWWPESDLRPLTARERGGR